MRTILFKAQRKEPRQWCYGYLHQDKSGHMRIKAWDYDYEIDPNTLCEYTGVHDVNDTMVFEHDIVSVSFENETYHSFEVIFIKGSYVLSSLEPGVSNMFFDGISEFMVKGDAWSGERE